LEIRARRSLAPPFMVSIHVRISEVFASPEPYPPHPVLLPQWGEKVAGGRLRGIPTGSRPQCMRKRKEPSDKPSPRSGGAPQFVGTTASGALPRCRYAGPCCPFVESPAGTACSERTLQRSRKWTRELTGTCVHHDDIPTLEDVRSTEKQASMLHSAPIRLAQSSRLRLSLMLVMPALCAIARKRRSSSAFASPVTRLVASFRYQIGRRAT